MKNVLLTSVALVFVAATSSFAATLSENSAKPKVQLTHSSLQMVADNDGGSDDHDGSGKSDNDGAGKDSNDDSGSAVRNDDKEDNDGVDDSAADEIKKPARLLIKPIRIPGGKGCDTARDRAEHPECVAG
jgi:hypothetical protein